MAAEERVIEETEEFKVAVKYVLKRQMKDLITQMREEGEEMIVMAVNIQDGTSTHFGTPLGDWFITEQKSLTNNFATFCKSNGQKKSKGVGTQFSSPKKVAATPRGRAKTATSSDAPTLKITVPKRLSVGISEQELGGLVGRIVASQLCQNKAKGDGSSGGTRFDALLESIKKGQAPGTPGVTRSGRKVSNKYLEGIKSARKRVKLERDDSGDEDLPESMILNQLTDLEAGAMKKVQVKTGDGKNIDVQKTTLAQAEQMEILASSIIKQLENVPNVTSRKQVKVTLEVPDNTDDEIVVHVDEHAHNYADGEQLDESNLSSIADTDEPMDDSDMEYEDYEFKEHDVSDDKYTAMSDPDFESNFSEKIQSLAARGKGKSAGKRKYSRTAAELTPMKCEHCGQFLAGKWNLQAHIKRIHLKLKENVCQICHKPFHTKSHMEAHMLQVHTRKCGKCDTYVVEYEPWPVGAHRRDKREVECECGEVVAIFTAQGRQKVVHVEEIYTEGDFNSPAMFACPYCRKMFRDRKVCVRHMKIHTDVDKCCYICAKSFTSDIQLEKHLNQSHATKMHRCNYCNKFYVTEAALKIHWMKAHKEPILKGKESDVASSHSPVSVKKEEASGAEFIVEKVDENDKTKSDDVRLSELIIAQGENGQIVVTTGDEDITNEEATEYVKQAITQGLVDVPSGDVSVIINKK